MSRRPPALRVAPHLLLVAVGYTLFATAALPDLLRARLGIGLSAFGLLTSAPLAAFVVAQPVAGRVVDRTTTTRVLLVGGLAHVVLAASLDAVLGDYSLLLAGRFAWGGVAGLLLSAGATHVARLESDAAAVVSQGVYGATLTAGGAVGLLLARPVVTATGGVGLHAVGAVVALPAIAVCVRHRAGDATASPDERAAGRGWHRAVVDPVVVRAAACYVAIIGSYITLSTFVTAYFDGLGVTGPLNALVLAVAAISRTGGGLAVWRFPVDDAGLIGVATTVGALGFAGLAVASGRAVLLALPFAVMIAVSVPFGAVYDVAASADVPDGTALAVVVAAGNVAALVLPPVTGALRESLGSYGAPFALLAALNVVAAFGAVGLARTVEPTATDSSTNP